MCFDLQIKDLHSLAHAPLSTIPRSSLQNTLESVRSLAGQFLRWPRTPRLPARTRFRRPVSPTCIHRSDDTLDVGEKPIDVLQVRPLVLAKRAIAVSMAFAASASLLVIAPDFLSLSTALFMMFMSFLNSLAVDGS
ncbi:unnamed protein product [Dibothriocephalus latus]|uniref:Uncharacterized protein n=1 Tax=Dibothriocephalus latus TaxID=60516 RepID=A0A3P7NQI7_DIBLA|nr:unnamed protein product [Dibothriocephalus latus]